MAQILEWIVPERILRVCLKDDLTTAEITSIDGEVYEALAAAPNAEALIFDITAAGKLPVHLYNLRMKRNYPPDHPLKSVCIVGEHRLLRLMLVLTYNATRASIQFFPNTQRLYAFLGLPEGGTRECA